mgnify:FL=1
MKAIKQQQMDTLIEDIWLDFLHGASAESLYQSVVSSNWDGNDLLRQWILNHEDIDQAVILAAYWMSGPAFAKQFKDEKDVLEQQSWYLENFNFIEQLEAQFLAGFWKNNTLVYDPAHDHNGYDWVSEYSDLKQIRKIHATMSQSLQAKVIKRDDAFEEGLPEPWLSQIWKLFKKYEVIENT